MAERYRIFRRNWWKDEARRICREYNCDATGERIKRPFGVAYEYEEM